MSVKLVELLLESIRKNIPHAQSLAADLVLIGGTDAFQHRTNLIVSLAFS